MVYALRRGTGQRRVGHAGTLDPLATGLLVMCLGPATRLSEYLAGKDKRYLARVWLGASTDTYDAQGQVTASSDAIPDCPAIEAALDEFRGPQQQVPPAYSAIKRGGQKAYELARRGEAVVLEARAVTIQGLELVECRPPEITLDVRCSAGTYIRSLAHDLGQRLGCGAHLAALRRTASGGLLVDQAVTLDALQESFVRGDWTRHLLPADAALADWPAVALDAPAAARVRQGQPISCSETYPAGTLARAYNPAGHFFAVLRADAAGLWHPDKVLDHD
jgi:tRNA pseudouridine55 synthase